MLLVFIFVLSESFIFTKQSYGKNVTYKGFTWIKIKASALDKNISKLVNKNICFIVETLQASSIQDEKLEKDYSFFWASTGSNGLMIGAKRKKKRVIDLLNKFSKKGKYKLRIFGKVKRKRPIPGSSSGEYYIILKNCIKVK